MNDNNNLSNGHKKAYGEQNGNHKEDKFEVPLPFGYHMDLDFLRFCSEQTNTGF